MSKSCSPIDPTELSATFEALGIPAAILDNERRVIVRNARFDDFRETILSQSECKRPLSSSRKIDWPLEPDTMHQSAEGRRYFISENNLGGGRHLVYATEISKGDDVSGKSDLIQNWADDVMEFVADWYWEQDADLRFSYMSPKVEGVTGVPAVFHIGKTREELHVGDDEDPEWQSHLDTLARHEPFNDFRFIRRGHDDRLQYLSTSGKPIFSDDGAFVGYRGVGRDITSQMSSEIARNRLASAIDELEKAVVLVDPAGRVTFYNQRYAEMSAGFSDILALGVPYDDVIHALATRELLLETSGQEAEWIENRKAMRQNPGLPFEQARSDGTWVQIKDQKFQDGSTITIITDITERKQSELALRESEERLHDFAVTSADWFWEQDSELRFTHVSFVGQDARRFAAGEYLGKTRREVIDGNADEKALAAHEELLAQRLPFDDFRFIRRDVENNECIISASGIPLFDENGQFRGYRGIGRDITRLVRAEERSALSEQRFRDFATASGDFFWETDKAHRFVFFSEEIYEALGIDSQELIGRTRLEFSAEVTASDSEWRKHLDDLAAHRPFRDFEYRVPGKDEDELWVSVSGQPTFDAEGAFTGYRGTASNITEKIESQHELQRITEQAVAASKAKSEFLSSMSHELRTPLNAISGFAQLLEGEVAPEHDRAVELIISSGNHLTALINQVLDFSRIEAGKLELSIEPSNVFGVAMDCIAAMEPLAETRGITIGYDFQRLEAEKVNTDPVRFKQIMLNLLSNAIKYNVDGGAVVCECGVDPDGVIRVSVSDSGIGIDPAFHDQVFEPFARLGAEASEIEGVGIGLVLCKSMIEAMGGEIGYTSVVGIGSTFWVTLPAAQGSTKEADSNIEQLFASSATDKASSEDENSRSILYIEDNADNRSLMRAIVKRDPRLHLTTSGSSMDAIELAEKLSPDLIMLDINLPEKDGYELLADFRRHPEFGQTPVLAVTAAAMKEDIAMGEKAGFQGYLTKPLDIKLVLRTIENLTC